MPESKAVFVKLICHGETLARRRGAFPIDEAILPEAIEVLKSLRQPQRRGARALCGPELRCRQSAEALGLSASPEVALSEIDFGSWRGRTLTEVAEADPKALGAWLTDPAARPHGGESIEAAIARVADWLVELTKGGPIVAVVNPSVARAATVAILGAPAKAFWRIDAAPGSITRLTFTQGRWIVREFGRAAVRD